MVNARDVKVRVARTQLHLSKLILVATTFGMVILPSSIVGGKTLRPDDELLELAFAVSDGNVRRVEKLLSTKPYLANARWHNKQNETPLHDAAGVGRLWFAKLLVGAKADVNARNQDGDTPLFEAAAHGHSEVAAFLVASRADVNVKAKDGTTALRLASRNGNVILNMLLEHKAEPDAFVAVVLGRMDLLRQLVDRQPEVIHSMDRSGQTLLFYAAAFSHVEITGYLLGRGAKINVQDHAGQTPLHIAAQRRNKELVRLLLDDGADVSLCDRRGCTPLELAELTRNSEVAALLIEVSRRR